MATLKQKYAIEGLRAGDVVGFSGQGFVSDAINLGSFGVPRWGLSHIGIIGRYRGRRYLFESTTLNAGKPCDILGQCCSGVQAHTLDDITKRPGKVWAYKLNTMLTKTQDRQHTLRLLSHLGTAYDYFGAGRSGGFVLRNVEGLLRPEDLSTFFCSELVALMLDELKLLDIDNASAQSPNSLGRKLVRDRITRKAFRIK